MIVSEIKKYEFDIDKFLSPENYCENCQFFEYDIDLNGDPFYFCVLHNLSQKKCNPCLFWEKIVWRWDEE